MEIGIEASWRCRNNLYEKSQMIDEYNDNADDDNAYPASFDNTEIAWLQVVSAISDIA